MSLALTVDDRRLMASLTPEATADLEYWRSLLEPLLGVERGVEPLLRNVAQEAGQPFATVRKRYYRAKRLGLLGILDRRFCSELWRRKSRIETCPVSQCYGLQQLWKRLCEENKRASKPQFPALVKMWKERHPDIAAIPEYADFPGWPKLPSGWTYANLMHYGPKKFELAAARKGRVAAKAHRPTVYTTRAGLYVGSHYMFDDKWNDLFVNTFAERQHGRPLEVYSFDYFSAKKIRTSVRVRTKDPEGKYKGVAEVMTRFTLAATLFLDGYSPRGTELVAEHGTANIAGRIAEALYDATDGAITLSESGMVGDPAHIGQYPGLVRGNPNHKAALESNNNLEHNARGALLAQTGNSVANRPEELAGRLTYNATLLAAYAQLPAAKAELLEFPILEFNQYLDLAGTIDALIAQSRDHELEGWVEAGNVVQAYTFGSATLLDTQLTPEQRAALPQLLAAGLISARPLRMSRQEVWDRGAKELVRIPGWLVCTILGDDLAREARITGNEFAIQDNEIGPSIYRYEPFITTADGHTQLLQDGEIYQVFINPFALGVLFVRDARGRYLGEAKQIYAPCRGDLPAVQRAMGEAIKRENELLVPLRQRHAAAARAKLRLHEHNADVVEGPQVAPSEARQRQRNAASVNHELAEAARNAAQPVEMAGSLYDEADEF